MTTKTAPKAPDLSDSEGLSVIELFDMFPTEAATVEWFENIRWAGPTE